MADKPSGMLQLPQPPQAGALQLNRSLMKAMRSSRSEKSILGAIIIFCFYISNIILPDSFVKISGKRQIVAYTCLLVTGCPSRRRYSLRRLMLSAIWSVVMPPFRFTMTYTMASSNLIIYVTILFSATMNLSAVFQPIK